MGEPGEQFEKRFIFDEPRILQRICHVVDIRRLYRAGPCHVAVAVLDVLFLFGKNILRQRDLCGSLLLVQRQHVAGRHPAGAG